LDIRIHKGAEPLGKIQHANICTVCVLLWMSVTELLYQQGCDWAIDGYKNFEQFWTQSTHWQSATLLLSAISTTIAAAFQFQYIFEVKWCSYIVQ